MPARTMRERLAGSPWTVCAVILLVLGLLWGHSRPTQFGTADQGFYVGIAHDLLTLGRYTDGPMFAAPAAQGPYQGQRPPGMRFAPLYPALLAGAGLLDPGFRAAMACSAGSDFHNGACPTTAPLVRGVQFLMLAGVYLLLWRIALRLTGSVRGAWIALALGLIPSHLLTISAHQLMTEIPTLFCTTAATAAALAAWDSPRPGRHVLLGGLFLGLATQTRPGFLYLFYAAVAVWLVVLAVRRGRRAMLLAAFALGFALPTLPWMARNAVVLDRPALTFGYASHTLVQRIAFDTMSWHDYPMAWLCWAPDGSGLGSLLVGRGACDRFALEETRPSTFYAIGMGPLMTETVAAAGGWEHHLSYLLRAYIFREPFKHAMVSLPFAMRGALIDHYWGLILGLLALWTTARAVRRRDARFLLLALPGWFMLAFQAAVAVNQIRYNLMLIPPYAVAGALAVESGLHRPRRSPRMPKESSGGLHHGG